MIRYPLARSKAASLLTMFNVVEAPVDVESIAKKLGFDVVPFDFPDTVSAVVRIYENGEKVIGVNKNQSHVRQRFSLAHELGHYLCGHESINHDQVVVEPEKRYQDPGYLMEQEADEFAAELLMPTRLLKKDFIDSSLNITRLAKKYDVSEQAMWIQVVNLELVVEALAF